MRFLSASEERNSKLNETYDRAVVVISALATAYNLEVSIYPFKDADTDCQRAVSDLAPLITETCGKRYGLVERKTLREYATVVEQALSAIDGVEFSTDTSIYDTRGGGGTCVGFAIGSDLYIVKLTATARERQRIEEMIDACGIVKLGEPETMRDEITGDAELEAFEFEKSRRAWAERKREDAGIV
jgi:hypothetical protein